MDFSGLWKDPKTTIGGVVVLAVTIAFLIGKCSFDQWWTVVGVVAGAVGGGLLLTNTKKEEPKQ